MSNKSLFFWGIYEGNEGDETWEVLHKHFEKLAAEDKIEFVSTKRKAVKSGK